MNLFSKLTLLVFLGTAACNGATKDESGRDESLHINIDGVKLMDLYGRPVDLKQFKGKTVFINFWATWCKPCLEEMPSIQRAKEILKNENIEFLFATEETTEMIEAFRAKHDYGFKYVKAGNMAELNIMVLPTTFIFDPGGKLAFSEMSYRKWDDPANINIIMKIVKSK